MASVKRSNETVFQNICDTSWLSKMFKNVCINPILNFVLSKFCCRMYTNVMVYFHHPFTV